MKQYLDLMQRIVDEGKWVNNERTGTRCLTVINADLEYNVGANEFPLVTTRKSYYKTAIAEFLGYIRGYTSAEDFRRLNCKTWDANANLNEAWLDNANRKGEDDMGRVYGAVGNAWPELQLVDQGTATERLACTGNSIDTLKEIYDNLLAGNDTRGLTWTFWNPGMFNLGCLRPCMHTHTFSLVDGNLYLTSNQRSLDGPLGANFNMVQVFTFLALMAQITGHNADRAFHKIVNAHIYEDQLPLMRDVQLKREPYKSPKLVINPMIKTLEDLRTWVSVDDFEVIDYEYHDPIKYPFTV